MKTNKASYCGASSKILKSLMLAALAAPGMAIAADVETTEHKEGKHVIPASDHTVTANIGLTSDYVFRGISQTSGKPALQGGLDYAHASGLYAGLWASNINWITAFGATGTANIELDTYFGFRNTLENEFNYDVGFLRYNYPGSYTPAAGTVKADTDELYAAVGYKWVSAKYSYGLSKFLTVPGAAGTSYIEVNANVPLGNSGFTFGAHAGKQTYKGAATDTLVLAGFNPTYSDYKLSVSKDFSGFVVMLACADTNAPRGGFYTTLAGKDLARSTAILSVTRSF